MDDCYARTERERVCVCQIKGVYGANPSSLLKIERERERERERDSKVYALDAYCQQNVLQAKPTSELNLRRPMRQMPTALGTQSSSPVCVSGPRKERCPLFIYLFFFLRHLYVYLVPRMKGALFFLNFLLWTFYNQCSKWGCTRTYADRKGQCSVYM